MPRFRWQRKIVEPEICLYTIDSVNRNMSRTSCRRLQEQENFVSGTEKLTNKVVKKKSIHFQLSCLRDKLSRNLLECFPYALQYFVMAKPECSLYFEELNFL